MAGENFYVLWKQWHKSYTVADQYINSKRYLGYKDSYNYYDIDIDKILLFKKVIMNILLDITM